MIVLLNAFDKPEKEYDPMLVTEEGMMTDVNDRHDKYWYDSIDIILDDMITSVKAVML